MSHELRTPLNSIIGFSELLLDEAGSELQARHREFIEDVLGSGRHLLALINDILDLSKIEAGQLELNRRAEAPADVLDEACQLVQPSFGKKRLRLERKDQTRREVLADRGKLLQVLLNLLSNAGKFSPDDTVVEVGCQDHKAGQNGTPNGGQSMVRFWVRDHGLGIDEQLRARLFQAFVQGESPLTKRHQGTGLGLAICKRLIEQHGGSIGVDSTPGKGSTFWFTLPAAGGASAHPAARAPTGSSVTSDGADDERRPPRGAGDRRRSRGGHAAAGNAGTGGLPGDHRRAGPGRDDDGARSPARRPGGGSGAARRQRLQLDRGSVGRRPRRAPGRSWC